MTQEIVIVREAYQAEQVARECAGVLGWPAANAPLLEYIESITKIDRIEGLGLLAYPKTLYTYPLVPIGEGEIWSGWEPYNESRRQIDKLKEGLDKHVALVSGLYLPSTGGVADIIDNLATRVRSGNLVGRAFFVHPNTPSHIANGHNV